MAGCDNFNRWKNTGVMCMCSVGEEGANEKINNILCEVLFMIGYAENPEMILPIINKIDEISEDEYGI